MDTIVQSLPRIARWKIAIGNLIALGLSVPLTYVSMIAGVFASDSGPNAISYIVYYSAYAIIPAVLTAILISQIVRSKIWMIISLLIPFVPIGLLFGLATVF